MMPILQTSKQNACQQHKASIEKRLHAAQAYCKTNGLRLTLLRQKVLKLILASEQPLGAYDLMAQLGTLDNKPAAPPTIYRTLDFLLAHGFIHRLASSNRFIACCQAQEHQVAAFLICESCQQAQEFATSELATTVASLANSVNFNVTQSVIEVSGICQQCQQQLNNGATI